MREILNALKNKLVRIYTVSAVESYLGTITDVKDDYFSLREEYSGETVWVAIKYIEAIKEMKK